MITRQKQNSKKFKGIYLLPNLITTAAIAFGFWSINFSIQSSFSIAAIFIVIAAILDGLDGRIARLTSSQSSFGAQYDSLSDVISFGVAPAVLIYTWNLDTLGKLGSFIAFIFLAATALRLARFNANINNNISHFGFQGLPSPAGAVSVASFVWYLDSLAISGESLEIISIVVVIIVAALMVSNFNYPSFKKIGFKRYVSFIRALILLALAAAIFIDPALMIMLYTWIYVVWGLIYFLLKTKNKLAAKDPVKKNETEKKDSSLN